MKKNAAEKKEEVRDEPNQKKKQENSLAADEPPVKKIRVIDDGRPMSLILIHPLMNLNFINRT